MARLKEYSSICKCMSSFRVDIVKMTLRLEYSRLVILPNELQYSKYRKCNIQSNTSSNSASANENIEIYHYLEKFGTAKKKIYQI